MVNDTHERWLKYIEDTKKSAEERRLKHYHGEDNRAKRLKKEIDEMKKQMKRFKNTGK